jgi:hypothetical protein
MGQLPRSTQCRSSNPCVLPEIPALMAGRLLIFENVRLAGDQLRCVRDSSRQGTVRATRSDSRPNVDTFAKPSEKRTPWGVEKIVVVRYAPRHFRRPKAQVLPTPMIFPAMALEGIDLGGCFRPSLVPEPAGWKVPKMWLSFSCVGSIFSAGHRFRNKSLRPKH